MIEEQKVWGKTVQLYKDELSGTHIIYINPYGYSSKHLHEILTNAFYVVSGRLEIQVYKDDTTEYFLLGPGDYLEVPPKVWHRFVNLEESTVCMEIYHVEKNKDKDIIREDEGGSDWRIK